ncbi:hypothetical protein KSF78_0004229 [Schistosoma japonicum]|nr:hypothetical protein KSF78_0004229 [Schistosoma japonicum]
MNDYAIMLSVIENTKFNLMQTERTHYSRLNRLVQVINENCQFYELLIDHLKWLLRSIENERNKVKSITEKILNYTINHNNNEIPVVNNTLQFGNIHFRTTCFNRLFIRVFINNISSNEQFFHSLTLNSSTTSTESSDAHHHHRTISNSISTLINNLLNIESHLPMKYDQHYTAAKKQLSSIISVEVPKTKENINSFD